MPDTSQISPFVASCGGGLTLNKDVFTMHPGEASQLSNFEPSIEGGYRRINGTTKYNSTIVPQVSVSTERLQLCAIFNDIIVVARGGTVSTGTTSGSWTSRATSKGTTYTYDFDRFNFDGNDKIIIATGEAAAFTLNTSYSEDIINATGGGTAPTNPKYVNHLQIICGMVECLMQHQQYNIQAHIQKMISILVVAQLLWVMLLLE